MLIVPNVDLYLAQVCIQEFNSPVAQSLRILLARASIVVSSVYGVLINYPLCFLNSWPVCRLKLDPSSILFGDREGVWRPQPDIPSICDTTDESTMTGGGIEVARPRECNPLKLLSFPNHGLKSDLTI